MHIAEFAVTNLASEKHEWSNCLFVFFFNFISTFLDV